MEQRTGTTPQRIQTALIAGPYSGKPKAWAPPYRTRAEAEIEAAKLRKVRMFCQIRRADGDEREVQR